MILMAKKKPNESSEPEKSRPPSRDKLTSVVVSKELYQQLKELADAEERSVSWMARKALAEFIQRRKPKSS